MRRVPLKFGVLATTVIILLGLSSTLWYSSRHTDVGAHEVVLNRGLSGAPESLDPQRISSNQSRNVLLDIGEGLVSFDATGQVVPGVADGWSVSNDQLTMTFDLRHSARWSNGDSVTAFDFVRSFRRLVDPATAAPYAQFVTSIFHASEVARRELPPESLGVVAIDKHTFEITLEAPTPHFIQLLAHPSTFPIHESFALTDLMDTQPSLSNGAYLLESHIVGSELTLVRNPYYWDDASTSIDRVVYHVVDQNTELNRYRAGELDVTSNIPENSVQQLLREIPEEVRIAPYIGIYYYGFNLTQPPFKDNQLLRQALSMAVDREVLVRSVLGRGEDAAFGWVPPGVTDYAQQSLDFRDLSKSEREAEARRLFEAAGFGPDHQLDFELRYNTIGGHERIAVALQSMWRDVLGVDVRLHNEEFRVFISNVRQMEDTQMFRLSWTGDYNDAYAFLQLFSSGNPSNLTGYSNPEVDNLLRQAEFELSVPNRAALLQHAEQIVLNDHPIIPLYFYVSKRLIRRTIIGWEDNVMDIHLSKHLAKSTQPPN